MMSRRFTSREKLLIVILSMLIIGLLYYQFIVKDVEKTIKEYDTTELETTLLIQQTKAADMMQMKDEMENARFAPGKVKTIASYNNIKREISELNDIFLAASTYNLDFSTAKQDGDAVRRDVNVTFSAGSYDRAVAIIEDLYNCRYRCQIRSINISSEGEGKINSGKVTASLMVTFYETMYNAETTDGLEKADGNETTQAAS